MAKVGKQARSLFAVIYDVVSFVGGIQMSECANQEISVRTVVFILAILPIAEGKITYVDTDAIGANDGSSWENAYNYLQDALVDANSMPKPVEIRVAQGTYKPDQGALVIPGDQMAAFQLINGVAASASLTPTPTTSNSTRPS